MKKKVIVLGGGLVGSVMALDLGADDDYDVTVADRSAEAAAKIEKKSGGRVGTRQDVDFASPASIRDAVNDYDLVVGAVPGSMGYAMMGAVIEAGRSMSDISFMGEDYFQWDARAKEAGVTLMEDVGVTPGFSNVLIGSAVHELDEVEDIDIYVTGLPLCPEPPFNYKFVFSPDDCLEEYVRPVRLKENGKVITKPALADNEVYDFDLPGIDVPRMEGFLTDGLRSLLTTIPQATNIREKTLRYPGTAEKLAFLRDVGMFSLDTIEAGGVKVRPRDVFASLAFPRMTLGEEEREFTFLELDVKGKKDGKATTYRFSMYDERDDDTGYTSMARTTGFPCVIMARLIAEGIVDRPGVNAPEHIGDNPKAVQRFIAEMEQRGVTVRKEILN
ncbi:MAG: saccharopine dehydrogenase family protein [Synergistales bacterium]|nr:saccharopine dehydrogenase family protein [Synergistales bacterium]